MAKKKSRSFKEKVIKHNAKISLGLGILAIIYYTTNGKILDWLQNILNFSDILGAIIIFLITSSVSYFGIKRISRKFTAEEVALIIAICAAIIALLALYVNSAPQIWVAQ